MKKKTIPLLITVTAILLIFGFFTVGVQSRTLAYNPVKGFIRGCRLYSPITEDNLTIIPVKAPTDNSGLGIITLDEALDQNLLTVKEVSKSGSVNTLAVWNDSKKYVFIMAGEILAGSKQDRVLQSDVLLPPKSGKVLVKVYCVEQGRWTYKSDKFYSKKRSANISVRQMAKNAKSQSAVWDSVDGTNRALGAASPSASLQKAHESEEVKREIVNYKPSFRNLPANYPKASGVVVLVNGKVLVCDLFSNRAVFKKMWPKLLDSYIIEAVSRKNRKVPSSFSSASTFMEQLEYSTVTYATSPGTGRSFEINSKNIKGSGIATGSTTVHMDAFPKVKTEPVPYKSNRLQRNYPQNNQIQQQQINPAPNVEYQD